MMFMFMVVGVGVGVGVGGVQLGVMAACIVLFVPMGMAGWHLSRNKMLFFSGALFITLAVFVHLTPFFPSSFSNFFSFHSSVISHSDSDASDSDSPVVVFDRPQSCISFLHHIVFHPPPPPPPPPPPLVANNNNSNPNTNNISFQWDWSSNSSSSPCAFQKLGLSDTCDLLNGSWVVVAGDSQARFFALSLLHLLLKNPHHLESAKSDLFKRHSDYHLLIPDIGIKFDFIWAPFVTNLTNFLSTELFNQTQNSNSNSNYPPDVLVMGSGLWHMLHLTNASDYGVSLQQLLRNSVLSPKIPGGTTTAEDDSPSVSSDRSPHLFWLGMPMLINSMLNTPEKRDKMSNAAFNAYDREVFKSKLLRQSGGPLFLLDMQSLTRSCGPRCTLDGMHYDGAVYEAAVHIMLNALLIESHQKI